MTDSQAPAADQSVDPLQAMASAQPVLTPQASLVWTAVVDIEPREALGPSSHGERFIVPICGGRFWGAPGHDMLKGIVRPGGADRQLLRPDGVKELHALYELQTDDGAVLTIDNRVIIDESVQPVRYALSRITVTAPEGPHAWLNRRLLIGTLQPLRPAREAVLIRAFLMTN
jgi:Protein of unknown function (DUF3237)